MTSNLGGYGMKLSHVFLSFVDKHRGLLVNQLSHQRGTRLWCASKIDKPPYFLSADRTKFTKRSDPTNHLGNLLIHLSFPFFGRFQRDLGLFAHGAQVFLKIGVFGGGVLFRVLERATVKMMSQFGLFETLKYENSEKFKVRWLGLTRKS